MPNNIHNTVAFKGDPETIKVLSNSIKREEQDYGAIDFNLIIPFPPELEIKSSSTTRAGWIAYAGFIYDNGSAPDLETEEAYRNLHPELSDESWSLGKKVFHNLTTYGFPTWYEWCISNWGTKWNADIPDDPSGAPGDFHYLDFFTANTAPHPIMQKLSQMYPDVTICHVWYEHPLSLNYGRAVYRGGHLIERYYPDEHVDLNDFLTRMWKLDQED